MPMTGNTTAAGVQLDKRPALHLVIVDDSVPMYVEREASNPEERQLQWDELEGSCRDTESATLMIYAAVSHGNAAHRARRKYALETAAHSMAEVIDTHVERGARGWVAILLADGSSDGELYDDYASAEVAQQDPQRCTYFEVSPFISWTVAECEEHLLLAAHEAHGCTGPDIPTCYLI
jgi:hypothetical protein